MTISSAATFMLGTSSAFMLAGREAAGTGETAARATKNLCFSSKQTNDDVCWFGCRVTGYMYVTRAAVLRRPVRYLCRHQRRTRGPHGLRRIFAGQDLGCVTAQAQRGEQMFYILRADGNDCEPACCARQGRSVTFISLRGGLFMGDESQEGECAAARCSHLFAELCGRRRSREARCGRSARLRSHLISVIRRKGRTQVESDDVMEIQSWHCRRTFAVPQREDLRGVREALCLQVGPHLRGDPALVEQRLQHQSADPRCYTARPILRALSATCLHTAVHWKNVILALESV